MNILYKLIVILIKILLIRIEMQHKIIKKKLKRNVKISY